MASHRDSDRPKRHPAGFRTQPARRRRIRGAVMKWRLLQGVILTSVPLSMGTDCGLTEQACVDFTGLNIEFNIQAPPSCDYGRSCDLLVVPEQFQVRVAEEPSDAELECDVPRAELVGDWPGLTLGAAVDHLQFFQNTARFILAHEAQIDGTNCDGVFYVEFFTRPPRSSASSAETWLTPSGERNWAVFPSFEPSDPSECDATSERQCRVEFCGFNAMEVE